MPKPSGRAAEQAIPERAFDLARRLSALAFNVSVVDLNAPKRYSAPAALARQVAMYLVHVVLGLNLTEIGLAFGRDRSTVSHACQLIEEKRDNPQFDMVVSRLEMLLKCMAVKAPAARQSDRTGAARQVRPPSAGMA